jgi:hypothetical protein
VKLISEPFERKEDHTREYKISMALKVKIERWVWVAPAIGSLQVHDAEYVHVTGV